ncbi:polysaccharide pyruvyl transferase family protein [Glaciecola siphonariae]|uniref:Polysaccharide pyruvyl transferase family protein n=1 Tax=Glaciecola siphonariae TaxID=521012 RepID=A0ABV9LW32_9ALTE
MKIPSIFCVSASDRYNYGDLLFPIVAKWQLEQCGPLSFHNVATVESNLSEVGALPTTGYDIFIDSDKHPSDATILIAGGQVLNSDWMKLLSFIKPRWFRLYGKYDQHRLKRHVFRQFKLNNEPLPFMPSNGELLKNNRIMYHAVGGSVPSMPHKLGPFTQALKAAKYVSVRDLATRRALNNRAKQASQLVPDSVISYSDLKPKASLPRQCDEPYICVQFGYQKSKHKLVMILKQLQRVYDEHGVKIGLLSIGNCPGHDDIKAAKWIKRHAAFPCFHLKHDHIDDITSALAHAKLFIGTSLHGAILSMTYNNPFVAVDKQINKLDAYTKTWAPEFLKGCVAYIEIARAVSQRLNDYHDYSDLVAEQKAQVKKSFEHIYALSLR